MLVKKLLSTGPCVSDLSSDIKLGNGGLGLFIHVTGDSHRLTVARFADEPATLPWACFYGDRAEPQAKNLVASFTGMLDSQDIRYDTEHREGFKEQANLLQLVTQHLTGKRN